MGDPTADRPADEPVCDVCDAVIEPTPAQYVLTWIETDAVQTRRFCSEDCREEWDDERPPSAGPDAA